MVVGKRGEDELIKIERHIKEVEEDTVGWQAELVRAIRWNDENYMKYCMFWLEVMANTMVDLYNQKRKYVVH